LDGGPTPPYHGALAGTVESRGLQYFVTSSIGAVTDKRVLELLRDGRRMTAVELGRALGLDRLPVRASLHRLHQRRQARVAGMAHSTRSWGDGGGPAIWEAVPEGG
jgi:hypothetical protein